RPRLAAQAGRGTPVPGGDRHRVAAAGPRGQRRLRLAAAVARRAAGHRVARPRRCPQAHRDALNTTFGPPPGPGRCDSLPGHVRTAGVHRMPKLPHACLFAALAVASFGALAGDDGEVTDPHQSLEDVAGERQLAWVRAQNATHAAEL